MKKFGYYGSLMIFFLAIFCKAFPQAPPRSQGTKITVTGIRPAKKLKAPASSLNPYVMWVRLRMAMEDLSWT
jgi:hypothetical protein